MCGVHVCVSWLVLLLARVLRSGGGLEYDVVLAFGFMFIPLAVRHAPTHLFTCERRRRARVCACVRVCVRVRACACATKVVRESVSEE